MAVISDTLSLLWQNLPVVLVSILLVYFTKNYFTPGVSSIPGPFLAKISNIWRFMDVARGRAQETHLKLHKKYGPYVRLGPNLVSICDLDLLKTIYGVNKGYIKTSFYEVQQQLANGKPTQTLFTTLDEDFHAKIKRPIAAAYSMSGLTEFEVFVDKTICTMMEKLDNFAKDDVVFDMGTWLQYYAFDVIGELTFGRPLGFLDKGADVNGIMRSLEKMLDYAGMIGQMPWIDHLLIKNPLKRVLRGGSTGAVAQFARECLNERLNGKGNDKQQSTSRRDFLDRFLEAKELHPNVVTDTQVFSYTLSNVNAGSDTTAISLRAVLYFTLKHPHVLQRLMDELESARKEGRLSIPVTWRESQELPYLDAVIKEALRLHPAVGLLLERVVPKCGLKLPNGTLLPEGTVVGINPWVMHHHSLFGEDLESFRPERWLQAQGETKDQFDSRRQEMAGASFTFGAGPRTCIGKNISLLEMYKLIPSLLYTYKVQLSDPSADWETCNAWFVRQKNIHVKLTKIRDGENCEGETV